MEEEQKEKQEAGGLNVPPDKGKTISGKDINTGKIVNIFVNFESATNKGAGGLGDPGDKGTGGAGDPSNKAGGGAEIPSARGEEDPGTRGGGGSEGSSPKNCKTVNIFINFEAADNFAGGSGEPGTKADASEVDMSQKTVKDDNGNKEKDME